MSNQLGSTPGGVEVATTPGGASGGGGGGVTSVTASAGLASSGGATPNITLSNTAVAAGSYTNVSLTVNARGQITLASSGTAPVTSVSGTAAQIASTGGATPVLSLIDTAVTPGSYTNVSLTVDAKGRITLASSGTAPVTSVTGTGPIVSSGGATPAISITAATTGAAGSMSAADKAKLDALPVQIDFQTLTNQTSYASPTWSNGTYRRIVCIFHAVTMSGIRMTFNSFAGSTGITSGTRIAGTGFSDTTNMYVHFAATTGEQGVGELWFDALTDGAPRGGRSETAFVDTATKLVPNSCSFGFENTDLTTNVLGFALEFYSSNFTGTVRVLGIPA